MSHEGSCWHLAAPSGIRYPVLTAVGELAIECEQVAGLPNPQFRVEISAVAVDGGAH